MRLLPLSAITTSPEGAKASPFQLELMRAVLAGPSSPGVMVSAMALPWAASMAAAKVASRPVRRSRVGGTVYGMELPQQ